MNRRYVLSMAAAACVAAFSPWSPIRAHTPYRQWEVYRRKHLLIGCHRDDPASYAISKGIVASLAVRLPDARSRVARGPTAGRLASLIATGQMDLAVLQPSVASDIRRGAGIYKAWGPVSLTHLLSIGEHQLVAQADFPNHHAWMVVQALQERRNKDPRNPSDLPEHPGARDFNEGLPMPHAPSHTKG